MSLPASPARPSTASSRTTSAESVPRVDSPFSGQIAAALKHPIHPVRESHTASSTSLIPPVLKSALKPHSELQADGTPSALSSPRTDSISTAASASAMSPASTTSSAYKVGLAFDLMDDEPRRTGGGTGLDFSFTLRARSRDYERTKQSREFMCCTDGNDYSVNALDWILEALIEDGDEMVILKVLEPKSDATQKDADDAKGEAQSVMDSIMAKNGTSRSISVVVEFVVGPLHSSLQRIIALYRPDSICVGTRGKADSLWRTAFIGSTSRYALERSPVPVIVVRPQGKVRKSLETRHNRRSYAALVEPEKDDGLTLRPTKTMPIEEGARKSRSPFRSSSPEQRRTKSLERPSMSIKFAEAPRKEA